MSTSATPTVLITGAAHRIGRTLAYDLSANGFSVAVHYNESKAEAEEVVREIEEVGGTAAAIHADLADEQQVETLVARAAAALGPLTALINNASVFENDTVEDAPRDIWDAHMDVNMRAPFILAQKLADQLPDGLEGNIVNILDQRVWNMTPYFMSYTVSKAGLWALTQTLALALAPNIRVNGIGPGPTLRSTRQTEEDFARQWSQTPLKRRVMPDEIADAVRYIFHAPSMTGQMIALDAGQHLGWAQATGGEPQE